MASSTDRDSFLSSCGDCSCRWHVEPDRHLVGIANVHKFVIALVKHEVMEVDNLLL